MKASNQSIKRPSSIQKQKKSLPALEESDKLDAKLKSLQTQISWQKTHSSISQRKWKTNKDAEANFKITFSQTKGKNVVKGLLQKLNQTKKQNPKEQSKPKVIQQVTYSEEVATQIELRMNNFAKNISCWNCYKMHANILVFEGKDFCSQQCQIKYHQSTQVQCQSCKKVISQQNGMIKFGEWYCSIECFPTEEDLYISILQGGKTK